MSMSNVLSIECHLIWRSAWWGDWLSLELHCRRPCYWGLIIL